MKKIIYNFLIIFIFLYANNPKADELLIYADNISYDSDKNIIAKGNAKIIKDGEIITSNLIIYNSKNKSFLLPSKIATFLFIFYFPLFLISLKIDSNCFIYIIFSLPGLLTRPIKIVLLVFSLSFKI